MAAAAVCKRLYDRSEVRSISDDFSLEKIGELPSFNSGFDASSLPTQPLAISEDFLFMAHSEGFSVVRKPSLIESAQRIMTPESVPLNVHLAGSVSILSMSRNSETLAACVGGNINFFKVKQFKDASTQLTPNFSSSLDEQEYVKDMRWINQKEYVVLSTDGKLYHGVVCGNIQHVLDNVDAFDWSVNDDSIAVARKNLLTIRSRDFEEILTMSLWSGNIPGAPSLKVDSVRWCRPDCFILGCIQLTHDGIEEEYIVRTIYLDKGRFTDTSCRPIMLSFDAVLMGDENIPSGRGPHLFLSCLKQCEFGIMTKKENDDHGIYLIRWSNDGTFPKIAVIHLDQNERTSVSSLQDDDGNDDENVLVVSSLQDDDDNDDENVLVGLCIDEDFMSYSDCFEDSSTYCVIFCMTSKAKLIVLRLAKVSNTPTEHSDTHAYIILLKDKPPTETIVTEEDEESAKDKHLKLLESVLGSMDVAKDSMMYSYKHLNGLAAVLSESDAKRIAKCPDVNSVVPDRAHRFPASCAYMNVTSDAWESDTSTDAENDT